MDTIKSEEILLRNIENNYGQVPGLPANPRQLTEEEFQKLKNSIREDPGMIALRELIVYPHNGKYVAIGGNMRLRALEELGYKKAPCKILPADTDVEQLKAYVIKDNLSFGMWDNDELLKNFSQEELEAMCILLPVYEEETSETEENVAQIGFNLTFAPEQFKHVKQTLCKYDKDSSEALLKILGYYGKE